MTTMSMKRTSKSIEDQLELPQEVSTRKAAEILQVDKKTVLKYYTDGQLPARNIAPTSSARPEYRFPLKEVVEFRKGYEYHEPVTKVRRPSCRTLRPGQYQSRHIQLKRGKH